jgi:hypothetical protein
VGKDGGDADGGFIYKDDGHVIEVFDGCVTLNRRSLLWDGVLAGVMRVI